jgi:hypothetical protein
MRYVPKAFVFVDNKTGMRRFEVQGGQARQHACGRDDKPVGYSLCGAAADARDFEGMIAAGRDLFEGIAQPATKLIPVVWFLRRCPDFPLSWHQREALAKVTQNMTNKEIAAKLNVFGGCDKGSCVHVAGSKGFLHSVGIESLVLQRSAEAPDVLARSR